VKKPTTYVLADLENIVSIVDANVGDNYLDFCGSGVNYQSTEAKGLELLNDISFSTNVNAGTGTMAGAFTLPANCAFCITLKTANTGRSARGRFYAFPAEDTALASVNTVSNTYRDGITGFLVGMSESLSAAGFPMVVLSRFTNKALRATGIGFPIIDFVARNNTMDSQRGRLPHNH